MIEPTLPHSEASDSERPTAEFPSKYFGQRKSGLFIVQSIAIWIPVAAATAMSATKVVVHRQPLTVPLLIGFAMLVITGLLLQRFAIRAWRNADMRRVVWLPDQNCLCIHNHRIFRHFMSFGSIVSELMLPLQDIRSHKVVAGRGRFLRLQTNDGFIVMSNDLEGFHELCDIVERRHQN